jgi:CcmD family protein
MNIEAYNLKFIVAAYSATWLVILGYHWRLARKSARVRAEYESVMRTGELHP